MQEYFDFKISYQPCIAGSSFVSVFDKGREFATFTSDGSFTTGIISLCWVESEEMEAGTYLDCTSFDVWIALERSRLLLVLCSKYDICTKSNMLFNVNIMQTQMVANITGCCWANFDSDISRGCGRKLKTSI